MPRIKLMSTRYRFNVNGGGAVWQLCYWPRCELQNLPAVVEVVKDGNCLGLIDNSHPRMSDDHDTAFRVLNFLLNDIDHFKWLATTPEAIGLLMERQSSLRINAGDGP